jgi:preprotein translocase subunit SecA
MGSVTVATNMAGRGVDIILGGNPEGLADQEIMREGSSKEENPERWNELLARFKPECSAEGDEVRNAGGLYVLGTERHESRRIDNQLRGRSGRQGDPGESRFYLSLEDDLMRIFATGAMNWVMGKALPDDVPIEAKMVSKAIERAQRTVEDRNFEIRKDVLKYDEVMNEQRKVVYKRRQQVLDGEDLKEQATDAIQAAITRAVDTFLPTEYEEEWDIGELLRYVAQYYPTETTEAQLNEIGNRLNIIDHFTEEALAKYEEKEATVGAENLREIERRVMLSVIDQKWREHLYEMDYLQEGINLRAMGQKDPLVEWQREGFDMFEAMMGAVEDDFVRYVFHLQVVKEEEPAPQRPRRLQYSAPEGPVQGSEALRQTAVAERAAGGLVDEEAVAEDEEYVQAPVRVEKTPGRNDPCYCGSGKKFKFCHGR